MDVWNSLGFRDPYPSSRFALQLAGPPDAFDPVDFQSDLAYLLRQVTASSIDILSVEASPKEGRRRSADSSSRFVRLSRFTTRAGKRREEGARKKSKRWHAGAAGAAGQPRVRRSRERRLGLSRGPPYPGYSGLPTFGNAVYGPTQNDGTTIVTLVFYGHKQRSVDWAEVKDSIMYKYLKPQDCYETEAERNKILPLLCPDKKTNGCYNNHNGKIVVLLTLKINACARQPIQESQDQDLSRSSIMSKAVKEVL